jgi:hypothetical protein
MEHSHYFGQGRLIMTSYKNCKETSSDRSTAHTIATTNDNYNDNNNKEKENKKDNLLYKLLSYPLYNRSILRYKV